MTFQRPLCRERGRWQPSLRRSRQECYQLNMFSPLLQTGVVLFAILELLTSTARGASARYFENFDSYPKGSQPANFTGPRGTSANGWHIANSTGISGEYVSSAFSTPAPIYAHSEINLDNVAGRNFTFSTKFGATAFTNGPILDATVGMIALSSAPGVVPSQGYWLRYVVATGLGSPGTFTAGGGSSTWQAQVLSTLLDAGQGFTVSLHGEHVAGALLLTATLSNGIGTIVLHGTDPSPPTGSFFGYWDTVSGTSLRYATLQAFYDDFSVTLGTEPVRFGNISTRMNVGSDDHAVIAGFRLTGNLPRRILIRGVRPGGPGPVPGALPDPTLELFGQNGVSIATNDNWKDTQQSEIEQTGGQPVNDLDSAIVANLGYGIYTAILRGKADSTGLGLIEIYDLEPSSLAKLNNFSTRGFVGAESGVMIGGIIALGDTRAPLVVRAIGPSLQSSGLSDPLADPVLELHDRNGALLASNDNWRDTQQEEIQATGLAPANDAESAILTDLLPTNYTAVVRGKNGGTGVALVEFYQIN